ncbi:NADH-quinone oxidoreductase subunit J [Buchnera aphidicola (Muscaphis stroyani)]|uniref:NADH-quinone oxidoreductase subunit J n=1 Tax=Buchnera aphidicola (Muscaphis stroyani) TaxID=1241869 RepID=A0A4D6YF88_9GAMM|nr:NADH-quinone oxidoreductase subunit J [Buchnera aphidicola]QCI24260.1 NADH-quinone oxidoreductase subunit J [Buchnera aphidicola (Muscaphis stroyani)]
MEFCFYTFGILSIISTIFVVFQKNIVPALVYLIISFLSISAVFFTIGAFFAGALQIIIYAGAIMVLFVFFIMMLNLSDKDASKEKKYLNSTFWIGPSILSIILLCSMTYALSFFQNKNIDACLITAKSVGKNLFGPYALLVELFSMLLLSSLIVVFHIGKK